METHSLLVLTEEEFNENMTAVSQEIEKYRQEGTFSGFDGKTLYYEYFLRKENLRSVVIVHGLSEFTKKYHELAWYLLNQGYNVFLYDQRCHGRSCRLTPRQDLIHVDHFRDYEKDLSCFIDNVVKKVTDTPLYLYAHSMGGAVSIQYLESHPDVFQKAVVSAPMVEPLTGGVPLIVARWGLTCHLLFGDGKKKFWYAAEFDPNYSFDRSRDQSRARFTRNMEIRLENPCYCTTPQSLRWVQQSLLQRRKMIRNSGRIRTPLLMISAEDDGVVSDEAQVEFAEKCPMCRRVVLPGSTHAMLSGTYEVITAHVQHVLDHFA